MISKKIVFFLPMTGLCFFSVKNNFLSTISWVCLIFGWKPWSAQVSLYHSAQAAEFFWLTICKNFIFWTFQTNKKTVFSESNPDRNLVIPIIAALIDRRLILSVVLWQIFWPVVANKLERRIFFWKCRLCPEKMIQFFVSCKQQCCQSKPNVSWRQFDFC